MQHFLCVPCASDLQLYVMIRKNILVSRYSFPELSFVKKNQWKSARVSPHVKRYLEEDTGTRVIMFHHHVPVHKHPSGSLQEQLQPSEMALLPWPCTGAVRGLFPTPGAALESVSCYFSCGRRSLQLSEPYNALGWTLKAIQFEAIPPYPIPPGPCK